MARRSCGLCHGRGGKVNTCWPVAVKCQRRGRGKVFIYKTAKPAKKRGGGEKGVYRKIVGLELSMLG